MQRKLTYNLVSSVESLPEVSRNHDKIISPTKSDNKSLQIP